VSSRSRLRAGTADFCAASPEYLQALGIPLVSGRFFDQRDSFNASHAAVIPESLARARWPHQDPIGQTIQFGNMDGDLNLLTQEIGVRMALGARNVDVLGLILRQVLTTTLIGVAIGVAGSFVTARAIQSPLFGVTPTDPLTFAGVALLLVCVAGLACYVPARRATDVDAMVALRSD